MTGTELFEALSFVDERYIQEAETIRLKGSIPWMKILSVAACLCILITGVLALENMGMKSAAPEAAAPPAAVPEAAPEAAPVNCSTFSMSVCGSPMWMGIALMPL